MVKKNETVVDSSRLQFLVRKVELALNDAKNSKLKRAATNLIDFIQEELL